MTKYFTNGELDDKTGTGVTLMSVPEMAGVEFKSVSPTGEFGYLAKEISKDEYIEWQKRISNPDMVDYFPGIFPGVGVVSKAVYSARQKELKACLAADEKRRLRDLIPAYNMAASVASATGQSPSDVLQAFRPDLTSDTVTALKKLAGKQSA